MFKFVVASCVAAVTIGQYVQPEKAKILKEQRFNAGDGRFGSAYAQEDGTVYREETSADGERVGQYSYIDNDGKTITVRYTAGKDGFRILEGDHVPLGANGQNSAQYVATEAPRRAQQPQQFAQQPQQFAQRPAQTTNTDYDYYEDIVPTQNFAPAQQNFAPAQQNFAPAQQNFAPAQPASNANPFINPHDPTHRNFQYNVNGGNYGGQQSTNTRGSSSVPPCADCAGVNPFINPYDASHRNPQAFAPQPTQAPRQQFQQPQQQFQQQPQQQFQQQFATTQAPRNFFPPGQLQLNRFENGFNFDFTSQ
jgi:hypothetical protein